MANERKFLEGELKFVEGQTSVDKMLKSIASELVKTGWVDYKKDGTDSPWAFDENREIKLPEVFKKENIKLFKTLAFTEILPSGLNMGKITIIRGVVGDTEKTIALTLNGDTYLIPLVLGDTKEQVATKVSTFVKALDGFLDTYVDTDGVSVIVKGESPVYNISTNYEVSAETTSDLITFSKTGNGIPTGTIKVLSDVIENGTITININSHTLSLPITIGQTANQVANNIRNIITTSLTGFATSSVVGSIVTVSGTEDVTTINLSTDNTANITNTTSSVQGGFGSVAVLSSAHSTGNITVTINGSDKIVPIIAGDTNVIIAQKIQGVISATAGFTLTNASDNTVTIAGSTTVTTLSLDTDVVDVPSIYTDSEANTALTIGEIEVVTDPKLNSVITVGVNGDTFNVSISGTDSKNTIAKKIRDAIVVNSNYSTTSNSGNKVRVSGIVNIYAINTSVDLNNPYPYVNSQIVSSGEQLGKITVVQSVFSDVNITVNVNGENIVVALLTGDTPNTIAEKIQTAILTTGADYAESTFTDNIVEVKGNVSVKTLSVSSIEIPYTDYEVIDDVIRGTGIIESGTQIGDNVEIQVIYVGEEFQRVCFIAEGMTNGDTRYVAQLKSRPKGEITLYEDTIISVVQDVLQDRGDKMYYKTGRNPISKALSATHSLKVYRGKLLNSMTLVDDSEYTVDYENGMIIFYQANASDDIIACDYGVKTGLLGSVIPKEKYRILNDKLIDMTATGELNDKDVVVIVNYHWELVLPQTLIEITPDTERIILKTKTDITSVRNKAYTKNYFIELKHEKADTNKYLTGLEIRYGTALDGSGTTLDSNNCSAWARTAWYDKSGITQEGLVLGTWLPVKYHMNFTQEYLNIVLHGSPNVDVNPYENYLISPIMLGALENYQEVEGSDIQYNFCLTVGSDQFYDCCSNPMPTTWGQKTGTGITDIIMERTGDGVPYQAHYPSFHTDPEFMDKLFIGGSYYTGSQHFSKIVVTHHVQRQRGMIQSVLIGDRSAIHHLDELITNRDNFNESGVMLSETKRVFNECGTANISKEKKWVMFNINAPYWMANNSPNVFYGIALRKS